MSLLLNKDRVAYCFKKSIPTYDQHAVAQQQISRRLLHMAEGFTDLRYNRVLEIGCCTGGLTSLLCEQHEPHCLYLNDLVEDFYPLIRTKLHPPCLEKIQPFFGDIEQLALPQQLDLIISSSTVQWLADLPGFFQRVAVALADSGYLVFSTFGPATLQEFTSITSIGLTYRPWDLFVDTLARDFDLLHSEQETQKLYFSTAMDVLRHLQATGVGGVTDHRWTKKGLRDFVEQYEDRFMTRQGVPVTYEPYYFIAGKKS